MKVVIAGGGTAGHVNPALAVAEAMTGDSVSFVGTSTGAEAKLVPQRGFDLDLIEVVGYDRARPLRAPLVAARALGAYRSARHVLAERRPDAVLGMGGYVSLPVVAAARRAHVPVVLHEQNIVLGLANKVGKRAARKVAVSFADTMASVGAKGVVTGNPVLSEIADADLDVARDRAFERFGLDRARKTILVFGGSLGAQTVNAAAVGLARSWGERDDVQIVHITGMRQSTTTVDANRLIYRSLAYVDDMIAAYAVADIALCRGGATTVAELGVVGLPAVIVPYPHHRDRQQELHGRVLERAGAALVVADDDASPANVGELLDELLHDDSRLAAMASAARSWGRPHAALEVADVVRSVA